MNAGVALAALAFCSGPAAAGDFGSSARGTTAGQFLELGVGARAAAMGEAYAAVADDATALYWNPAALSSVQCRSAAFMHAAYVDSSRYDYAAFAQNLGEIGAFGVGVQYFAPGSIDQTDATGATVGTVNPYDLALSAGFARRFGTVSVGVAVKYIQSKLLHTAQTAAMDVGLLSPGYLGGRLRLAATAANIGGALQYDRTPEALPFAWRAGAAYRALERLLTSLDVVFPRDDIPYAALGTEYRLAASGPWRFLGRCGFNSQTLGSVDGITGISFGIGVGYRGFDMDYGFVPLGGVGQMHRVSVIYDF